MKSTNRFLVAALVLAFGYIGIFASQHAFADVPKTAPSLSILEPDEHFVLEKGTSQSFAVALSEQPESKVIIKVVVSDNTEAKVDVTELEFLRENWNEPQMVTVTGLDDKETDGNIKFEVQLKLDYTKDKRYKSLATQSLVFENIDDDASMASIVSNTILKKSPKSGEKVRIRIVTANTTTGEDQSYDNGEGIRIFKALKPDIVLIQEFNYNKNSIKSFVTSTFGKDFVYHRGTGTIPNGIISKYPIIQSGGWKSNMVKNRDWDWAVIDIPGDRDLLVVSVHLYTQDNEPEMGPIRRNIENKIKNDNKDYYVMLGGDFNQSSWDPIRRQLDGLFVIGTKYNDWPQDQEGMVRTNVTRHKQIDYLLCNPDLCAHEVPVVIGKHKYPHGHVLDSRVYKKLGEMADIAPVKPDDSDATKMQHMAVVRDFEFDAE